MDFVLTTGGEPLCYGPHARTRRLWVRSMNVRARAAVVLMTVLVATAALAQERGRGETFYFQYCGSCHQPNEKGIRGLFPPLAGNEAVTSEDAEKIKAPKRSRSFFERLFSDTTGRWSLKERCT